MIRRISTLAVCLALCGAPALGMAQNDEVDVKAVDVKALVEQIKAGGDESYLAVDRLAAVKQEAAVKALTAAASAEDPELRWRAARALSSHGADAAGAVSVLAANLKHADAKVRGYSVHALGTIGEASKDALPKMVDVVTDKDALVRRSALMAIQKLKADPEITMPLMIAALKDADPRVATSVLQQLANSGPESLPRLIKALETPEAAYWATIVAAEMGPQAAPAVPALIKVLDSKDAETRMNALMALGEIGPQAKPALRRTTELLASDPTGAVRYAAAYALANIGDQAASDALEKAASGQDPFLVMVSTYALAALNPQDEELEMRAARKLISGLDHEDSRVRAVAARSLSQLEVPGDLVAPLLAAKLRDKDPTVAANVRDAIISIGPSIIPRVVMALDREELRPHAVSILNEFGADAKPAVPKLVALLDRVDPPLQEEILMTLGTIGPDAAPAVDQAAKLLASEDRRVKLAAVYALGRIGPNAASALDPMLAMIANEEGFSQIATAWAVANIAPDNMRAANVTIPVLVRGLEESSEVIREESALALGMFGRRAQSAIPALKKAANQGSKTAAEALKRIE